MKTVIVTDVNSLARAAADIFVAQAQEALQANRRFTVALSGGSTPRSLYQLLADIPLAWENIHIFWGDERCVPPDHADSNYRMTAESLLSRIRIPTENIHRIAGELPPDEAALRYENELRQFFGDAPRFDLILLGLGDDGHTVSLFPDSPALHERTRWVVAVPHATPPPPLAPRVTLTPVAINAARQIVFLVSGAGKAERLAEVLQPRPAAQPLPAQLIQPVNGDLLWLVDKPAATLLSTDKAG